MGKGTMVITDKDFGRKYLKGDCLEYDLKLNGQKLFTDREKPFAIC